MPAVRLTPAALKFGRFDVMGFDAEAPPKFVRHVGLASDAGETAVDGPAVELLEMGPPLGKGIEKPQCAGHVPLTVEEENRINLFVEEQVLEHQAAQLRRWKGYIVHPHVKPHEADDGTVIYHLYSCAGFVVEAYRATEIDVVVTENENLPLISLKSLLPAYEGIENHPDLRAEFGIPGDGPWPVLMPGYVLRALARPTEEIRNVPYQPLAGDELFE